MPCAERRVCISCVRAGCPPLSFRFLKSSEVVWLGDFAMQFVRLTMRSVLPSFTVRLHDAASSSRPTSFTGWGANLPRDMRTLTCVLDEADRLGLQKQRRVTLPLLREAVTSLDERQHARQAY